MNSATSGFMNFPRLMPAFRHALLYASQKRICVAQSWQNAQIKWIWMVRACMKSTLGPHSGPSHREVSDRGSYGGPKHAWHLALETICIKHMDITCNPVNRNENYRLRAKRIVPKESLMIADWTNFTFLAFFSALLRTRSGTWGDKLRSPLTTGKYKSNQIKSHWQQVKHKSNLTKYPSNITSKVLSELPISCSKAHSPA